MTKWEHFKHALGIHDWHKTRELEQTVNRVPCGLYDPRPFTKTVTMVQSICCQCGIERTIPLVRCYE